MKKSLIILLITMFVAAYGYASNQKQILAKVNNYQITSEEFQQELEESPYSRDDTYESKKEALDAVISRKLILQEAQKRGLDKDEKFLKMIEKFWEQSLLKIAVDKKSREIAGTIVVNDKDIEDRYQKMLEEGKADKPYDAIYNQLKWDLTREKEAKFMDQWIIELYQNAHIQVKYDLLQKTSITIGE